MTPPLARTLVALLAVAAAACAPERPPAPPATTVIVPPETAPRAALDASPDAAATLPQVEPSFLTAAIDTFPLRARLAGAGRIAVLADRSDARAFARGAAERDVPVVDEGARAAGGAVRVLCVEPRYRVAAYVDRAALATVARERTVLALRPPLPSSIEGEASGVIVGAGTAVERTAPPADPQPVRVRVSGLDASGLVRAASLDEVYVATKAPLAPAEPRDPVEITASSITLLDAPGGAPLATVTMRDDIPIALAPRGPRRAGHALVAFQGDGVVAVGWLAAAKLAKSKPAGAYLIGRGGLGLRGVGLRARTVHLSSGQLLEAPASGEVVGRVSESEEAICVDGCDSGSPTVELFACATLVHVRARPRAGDEAARP